MEVSINHVPGFPRFTLEKGKMGGYACIRGYRFTLALLLEKIALGVTADELLEDYPFLEPEDISDAIKYAAKVAQRDYYLAVAS